MRVIKAKIKCKEDEKRFWMSFPDRKMNVALDSPLCRPETRSKTAMNYR